MPESVKDSTQEAWSDHKILHKPGKQGWHYCVRRGQGRSLYRPEFKWTGSLRPCRIGPTREVSFMGGSDICSTCSADLCQICGCRSQIPYLNLTIIGMESPGQK